MKVLWIVNLLLPEIADKLGRKTGSSGTWLIDLSKGLSKSQDFQLAIACVNGDQFLDMEIGNIRYFCLPGNGKTMLFYHPELVKYWEEIERRFCPDIVHFHGTEYSHGLSYLRRFPDKKKLLTIQGIIEKTSQNHWGGLPLKTLLKYRTLKEYAHFNGMIERKIVARRNVKYEREFIQSVDYATGRTDWDKFYMQSLNPNLKYYRCNYNLRDEFYTAPKWQIDNCARHRVYASTSTQVPMKGGHFVLPAVKLVSKRFPDAKFVFLASKTKNGMIVPTSGYTRYILDEIKRLGIEKNVEFVGSQKADGIIKLMLQSNVTVVPSAMENASATLRESMHLGVPSIAAFRGGMPELINDGETGYLYDYSEYEFLAGRIIEVFSDDKLAEKLSANAIKISKQWHNREKNVADLLCVYNEIMEKKQ